MPRGDAEDLVDLLVAEVVVGLGGRDDQVRRQLDLAEQVAVFERHVELVGHLRPLSGPVWELLKARSLATFPGPCSLNTKVPGADDKRKGPHRVVESFSRWPGRVVRASSVQMGRTFSAWGPLGPWVTSNSTFWFSSRAL